MARTRIQGDGVAARCCAHLLGSPIERGSRARVPVILLSDAAQNLMRDIFQRDDLFGGLPRITRRVVKWGAAPTELPHSAVVISEEHLLDRLGQPRGTAAEADWTVCAAPPLPASTVEHRFGSRVASAVKVKVSDDHTCWIEAVEDGWLFLNSGWLLAVGAPQDALLGQSSLVRKHILDIEGIMGQFPASPRMISPLGGERWIACGSAAMGFDPVCGDGTAHAVREAILAAAVIRASEFQDSKVLVAHYEARLVAGFQRHLVLCRQFYSTGGSGGWWKSELSAVEDGIAWCTRKLEGFEYRYRLEGLELVRNL